MSLKLGITGGIGSGKSVVARLLTLMGVPVYNCDTEARRLMTEDPCIRRSLIDLIGADAYHSDGTLNKPAIAAYLFASPDHAARINAVVHPRVRTDFGRWADEHAAAPVVAMESAILFEAGFEGEVDRVIEVHAPVELRVMRIMARDHIGRADALRRIAGQMDEDVKCRRAHLVIPNDGTTALMPLCEQAIVL